MKTSMIIEMVGYAGSVLVLVAFLMTSVVRLRIVNSIGSLIFAVYALIIHSYPTAIMNFCLVLINIHYLRGLKNKGNSYELISVEAGDHFLDYMLNHYREDIEKCFPGIRMELAEVNRAYIVCCSTAPAGVMLGKEEGGVLDIMLDYSTPAYRDCSIGEYLLARLPEKGIRTLRYAGPVQNHREYLSKMGFALQDGIYRREL